MYGYDELNYDDQDAIYDLLIAFLYTYLYYYHV